MKLHYGAMVTIGGELDILLNNRKRLSNEELAKIHDQLQVSLRKAINRTLSQSRMNARVGAVIVMNLKEEDDPHIPEGNA